MCCQWFPPLEAALILYNDSRPFSTTPATDATRKKKSNTENYRHGFLPITDCSANQLSVPINRQNRWIGRPLIYIYIVKLSETVRISPCTLWAPAVCHQEHPSRSSLWHQGHPGNTGSGGHPPSRRCYCETGRAPEEQNHKNKRSTRCSRSMKTEGVMWCDF